LGAEVDQNEKTAEVDSETQTSSANNGIKYMLLIGFLLTVGVAFFIRKRR